MRDPFAPNSNSSMFRDAQIGLLLVAVLLGLFVYVAYYRITGQGKPIPDHVRMAPIAEAVWPNGPPANPSFETAQASSPAYAVPSNQHSPIIATNPAPRVAATNLASTKPTIQKAVAPQHVPLKPTAPKPVVLKPFAPEPVRTDRRVRPVDFQKVESTSQAATEPKSISSHDEILDRLGLKPGDKIDSNKIRRRIRPTRENLFGGNLKTPMPKIIARETVKPKRSLETKNPTVNSFEPRSSIFEHEGKQRPDVLKRDPNKQVGEFKPDETKFEPVTTVPKVETDFSVAVGSNSLRPRIAPEIAQPRMVASKPTLRSAPKPVDNSFQAAANSFQPTTVAPNRAETKPEKTSLAPQHDIAKSAALMTDAAPEEPSAVAVSTVDLPSPTEKFAASHASPAFRVSGNSPKTYVSKEGDSFWSIATEQYGDGRLFDALYRWNKRRVKSFDDLPVATELDIPTKIELARRWPDLCPSDETTSQGQTFGDQTVADYDATLTERLYTTQEGDTLFEIAAEKLGQASRYVDIMAKNDQRLPSDINHSVPLQPGLRLVLPE